MAWPSPEDVPQERPSKARILGPTQSASLDPIMLAEDKLLANNCIVSLNIPLTLVPLHLLTSPHQEVQAQR